MDSNTQLEIIHKHAYYSEQRNMSRQQMNTLLAWGKIAEAYAAWLRMVSYAGSMSNQEARLLP